MQLYDSAGIPKQVLSTVGGASTVALYALGNTTENSSTVLDAAALSINGLGALTAGFSNGSIDLSAPLQTNQTIGLYASSNTYLTSSGTVDARSVSLRGDKNITVGVSAGEFVFSVGNYLTTAALSQDSSKYAGVGETVGTVGGTDLGLTVNTDGVSIKQANWLTTARASTDAVGLNTAKTNVTWTVNSSGISLDAGAYLTTAMASNRGTDFVQATAAFAGTNASGTIASNGISVSVAAAAVQSNQTVGLYASSNTYLTSSGTVDARSLSFRGDKSITVGVSSGEVVFSVGAYLTTAALSQDSSKYAGTNGAITNGSITVNTSGVSVNVPAQTNQTVGLYASSNTYLTSSGTVDARSLSFRGDKSITVGVSAGEVLFSVGAYLTTAALSQDSSKYAGVNGAVTNGSITVNTSGVSVNIPVQTNQTIGLYASSNTYLTSSGTVDARSLSIRGDKSITVGVSAGEFVLSVGAYLTTAALSGDTSKYAGINGAITGGSITVNTSGVSINLPAYLTTADLSANSSKYIQEWALTGNSAGTTSSAQGTRLYLSGGNNVTISGSSNSLVFSVGNYLTTAALSGDTTKYAGVGETVGTTAGTDLALTVNTDGVSIGYPKWITTARGSTDAVGLNTALTANGVSWTVNSSGISLNVPAFLTTARASNDAIGLNTTQTNVTWTVNSSGLSINAAGYAGTVTGATNVSVTVNSSGVSINVPVATYSYDFMPFLMPDTGSATATLTLSNLGLQPFTLPNYLSFGQINFIGSNSIAPTSASNNWSVRMTNSSRRLAFSLGFSITNSNFQDLFLFSRGSGVFSSELETFASTRNSFITYYNVTYSGNGTLTNTAGGNLSLSQQFSMSISYPMVTSSTATSIATNSTYTAWGTGYTTWASTASNSTSDTISTSVAKAISIASTYPATAGWSSWKMVEMNWATSLTPGQYWLGVVNYSSTSSSSSSGFSTTGAAATDNTFSSTYNASQFTQSAMLTYVGKTNSIVSSLGWLGFASQATMAPERGLGTFSGTWASNTTYVNNLGNPAGAVALSQINTSASFFQSWFQMASMRI